MRQRQCLQPTDHGEQHVVQEQRHEHDEEDEFPGLPLLSEPRYQPQLPHGVQEPHGATGPHGSAAAGGAAAGAAAAGEAAAGGGGDAVALWKTQHTSVWRQRVRSVREGG